MIAFLHHATINYWLVAMFWLFLWIRNGHSHTTLLEYLYISQRQSHWQNSTEPKRIIFPSNEFIGNVLERAFSYISFMQPCKTRVRTINPTRSNMTCMPSEYAWLAISKSCHSNPTISLIVTWKNCAFNGEDEPKDEKFSYLNILCHQPFGLVVTIQYPTRMKNLFRCLLLLPQKNKSFFFQKRTPKSKSFHMHMRASRKHICSNWNP